MIKTMIAVLALTLSSRSASADESNRIEGARKSTAYWKSMFRACSGRNGQTAWYGVSYSSSGGGSIMMILELEPQLNTAALSQVERLNGIEFKATASLSAGQIRWWIAEKKAWRDWEIGEILSPIVFVKKRGIWSQGREFEIKPLAACSQVPPMDDDH